MVYAQPFVCRLLEKFDGKLGLRGPIYISRYEEVQSIQRGTCQRFNYRIPTFSHLLMVINNNMLHCYECVDS